MNYCFIGYDGRYNCGAGVLASYTGCEYYKNDGMELTTVCDCLSPQTGRCTNPAAIAAAEQEDRVFKTAEDVKAFHDHIEESTKEMFERFDKARRESERLAHETTLGAAAEKEGNNAND